MVGIAQLEGPFRYTMKAHDKLFCTAMSGPIFLNACSQSLNVAFVIVIVIHKAKLGQIARF